MINSSLLSINPVNGRMKMSTSGIVAHFNGGTPTVSTGELSVRDAAPVTYLGGFGYDAGGNLCISDGGTPIAYIAGIPVTANGKLCVSGGNTIVGYAAGLPVDSLGRICADGLAPTSDPNWANVVLLMHMDGANGSITFVDSSTPARLFSASGDAKLSTARANKIGTAAGEFDGTGDVVACINQGVVDYWMSNVDFTIEGFAEVDTVSGLHTLVGAANGTAQNSNYSFQILQNGAGILGDLFVSNTNYRAEKTTGLAVGSRVHWAFERYGNNLDIYIGGVKGTTANVAGVTTNNPTNFDFHIGMLRGLYPFDGMLDEIRITKGYARYRGNFTPPTTAFPGAPALFVHMGQANTDWFDLTPEEKLFFLALTSSQLNNWYLEVSATEISAINAVLAPANQVVPISIGGELYLPVDILLDTDQPGDAYYPAKNILQDLDFIFNP